MRLKFFYCAFLFIFLFTFILFFLIYFIPVIYADNVKVWLNTCDIDMVIYGNFVDNCLQIEGPRLTFLKSAAIAGSIAYKNIRKRRNFI